MTVPYYSNRNEGVALRVEKHQAAEAAATDSHLDGGRRPRRRHLGSPPPFCYSLFLLVGLIVLPVVPCRWEKEAEARRYMAYLLRSESSSFYVG